MTERKVLIKSDAGVHARPAMMLVKEAMRYRCDIRLIKDDMEADCKSIMSVLGLAITSGSRVTVRADGDDEVSAVRVITDMIENNFRTNEEISEKN
jgi:phosphocarrier protein HPr